MCIRDRLNIVALGAAAVIIVLVFFDIPYAVYEPSAKIMTAFIGPATVALALPLYRYRHVLLRYALAIMGSVCAGTFVAVSYTHLHFHHVASLQRAAENQDEAGKEVVDDGLHAKTDTHGKTASHHGEVAQFHAKGLEYEKAEEAPEGIGKRRLYGGNERGVYLQALLGQAAQKARTHTYGCARDVEGADDHEDVYKRQRIPCGWRVQ